MSQSDDLLMHLAERVTRLEAELSALCTAGSRNTYYTVSEFAARVGRAPYTVREWARQGRIQATRRATGGGPYRAWVISQEELLRYQQRGLRSSES